MSDGLVLDKVSIRFGRHVVMQGVDLRFGAGQVVGLVGPNGAGKSTLLGAVAGLVAHRGRITFNGQAIDPRAVGYMPQHAQVRAQLSVLEVVLLGRHERLGWRVDQEALAAAGRILASFGIADLASRAIHTLSGGQQQLVLLAQRLLREPRLLLLDEATSALDLAHQMQVFALLRVYVARTGALVMIAIHDLNLAARHADSVALLTRGGLAGAGRFDDVVTPAALRTVYGVEAEFLTCSAARPVILPIAPFHPVGTHADDPS
ncbi:MULTISPECIES: ABC transporter ATP-binding protein [Alphaproteobacteria]|uniref:Ferrichrome ABC transporter n=2 Tax=Alphaproteobacteria TaxID=28211 RepID=A0A512HK99_9HYPH|nr:MULTISPECIES: ABC transporter ATP-binding protein [Alphaproteobacteria]GEO85861.1 ferrichrome ABC transporter [Ciceribacter naphthalenivorans]GLR21717.1 ferrichrome ABC transporter [Ciceribacter naphthalenivorans]GLT04573.1 ferrichrome ABC transporter [Sphingomonas psychrolutea]